MCIRRNAGRSTPQITVNGHENSPSSPLTGSVPRLERLATAAARPDAAVAFAAGFVCVAAAVFAPDAIESGAVAGAAQAATETLNVGASTSTALLAGSASPLVQLDAMLHGFVAAHTSAEWRAAVADIWISDAAISVGLVGWLAVSLACLARSPAAAVRPLGLAWATYVLTCGAVGHGDPPLVAALKSAFARPRPSVELHHTFSFPSGHTSAAVFTVGALLAVLLPLALRLWAQDCNSDNGSSEADAGVMSGSSSSTSLARDGSSTALALWAGAWVTTGAGRVLADAHWLSDTLAGGLLASGVVCLLAWAVRAGDDKSTASAAPDTQHAASNHDAVRVDGSKLL